MSSPDDHVTVHHLDDGWVVHVSGPVEEEIGYCGGHVGGGRHFFRDEGTSDEELRVLMDAQRAEDLQELSRTRAFCVRVVRDGVDVTVVDEQTLPAEGVGDLLWPPIVTPTGLVLRWDRTITLAEHQEDGREVQPGEAPLYTDTEVQRPWHVGLSGEITQLPFELAVRPLAADVDGRLLLPSCHPLWWDGDDESFTWIDVEGVTETLLIDGAPVTVSRICTAIGEPFSNGVEDADDGVFWEPIQGRLSGSELIVRLRGDADERELTPEGLYRMPWVTVSLSLGGPWLVRVVERGLVEMDAVPLPL